MSGQELLKGDETKMNKTIKKISPALAGLLIIFSVMTIVTVPAIAAQPASATRDIQTQTLAPDDSTSITVTITNNITQSLSLDEDIPAGWTLSSLGRNMRSDNNYRQVNRPDYH